MINQELSDAITDCLNRLHALLPEDAKVAFVAYATGDQGFNLPQTDGEFDELIAAIESCRENEQRSVN